ncbi:L-fuconolactonase [Novosphingobium sp. CF614]|uniref:amidohydrolase family protein n=1 Tax=Novosphingobium sp. CF614 TaxID=1884364 RepID=UPI0008E88A10|nr:amidohydrolase family protein [Novosphingobium sp. CF614]SFF72984.1 L-fuconolactonase [Novosphingobium sp. CF614]
MILDAHQHFWVMANPFTDWPTPGMQPIDRDFLPADLAAEAAGAGVTATVLVQAAPCLAETHWLLDLARANPLVRGVVGWVDLAAPDAVYRVTALARQLLLKGLRPMLQDIAEPGWVLRPDVEPAMRAMSQLGLGFDALVRHGQIADIAELARRHPDLRIVLDHGGKPDIAGGGLSPWARDIEALAAHPNVWCKLSGLWTEAGGDRSDKVIAPYVDQIIACFGAGRTIWGSDWPVIRLAGEYRDWLAQCRRLLDGIGAEGRKRVFALNGMEFYGLAAS